MAKRKLSQNQRRRMQQSQAQIRDTSHEGLLEKGLVIACFGKTADIEMADKSIIRCNIRAKLSSPVAGDTVYFFEKDESKVIESIEPRHSQLQRPDPYGKMKTVAANIDQMLITIAPEPEPMENLIDRYIVAAELSNIEPILVINKSDLISEVSDLRDNLLTLSHRYKKIGYKVLSATCKSAGGTDELIDFLNDKVSVFVGQSGVGKSSLIQALLPEHTLKIGEISEATSKGKHTTTHSQLFHFNQGGAFVDSPGIREFGLWHVDKSDVIKGFKDIQNHADYCKFRNCQHENEPGCHVLKALKNGDLSEARFKSYRRILHTIDDITIHKNNR